MVCGKNNDALKLDENGNFCDIDLVVVGVENETDSSSIFLQRLLNEGQNVAVRLDPLTIPEWFDKEKYKKGQQYFYNNFYAMFVTKLCGLIVVLSVPSILRVLILTGKSNTPAKAFRRYLDTISNMLDWYNDAELTKNESDSRKSIISVRGKHCAAGKKAVTNGLGFISQRDMALTQFGFVGVAILKGRKLGFAGGDEELEGFIHLWRTIGYCMGIEDRFNICGGTINQVVDICGRLTDEVFKPLMEKPCENFNEMSNALLLGLKPVVPLLTPTAFMEVCRRNMNFEPREVEGWFSRWTLAFLLYINTVLLVVWWAAAVFRPLLNCLLRFSIYCNIKFPLVAYLSMGKETWVDCDVKDHHGRVATMR